MDSSVSPKNRIGFLRVCHHISTGLCHTQGHVLKCLWCIWTSKSASSLKFARLFIKVSSQKWAVNRHSAWIEILWHVNVSSGGHIYYQNEQLNVLGAIVEWLHLCGVEEIDLGLVDWFDLFRCSLRRYKLKLLLVCSFPQNIGLG